MRGFTENKVLLKIGQGREVGAGEDVVWLEMVWSREVRVGEDVYDWKWFGEGKWEVMQVWGGVEDKEEGGKGEGFLIKKIVYM